MARRSRLAGRFGPQFGWAARSLCWACLCACRQIQLGPKIRWQISFPAKKSAVLLRLIFSWSYSFFCAPAFGIFIRIEPQLTLCDSAAGILRRSFGERQAESFGRNARNLLTRRKKKVTQLLPARCADVVPAIESATLRRYSLITVS